MPRGPPPQRLKLHDLQRSNRAPTPEDESPSPYETSPNMGSSQHETRFPFPDKGSKKNPFPFGLPHANHFGAIRPRPFTDVDKLELLPAPEIANWRPNEEKKIWEFPYRNVYNTNLRKRTPPKIEKKHGQSKSA